MPLFNDWAPYIPKIVDMDASGDPSDEDIQAWQQTLLAPSKTEFPQNLISMDKTVHAA